MIHGVDLHVADGEFVVFVGPSGCGKSTLLRIIAGLEEVTAGAIAIDGEDVTTLPASERGLAMVFQSYALYPHMSVYRNMAFALENMGLKTADIDERVQRAATMLRLGDYLDRKPRALSGGQRQRVAIGRAIVRDPKIFLFDEPLSNLDAELRVATRKELAGLHAELGGTMIYVTHDQVEAMTLADRIVVLRSGRIEQIGTPLELYNSPDNLFVAGFIGSPRMNLLPGRVVPAKGVAVGEGGHVIELAAAAALPAGSPAMLGIRPEHITLARAGEPAADDHDRPRREARRRKLSLRLGAGAAADHGPARRPDGAWPRQPRRNRLPTGASPPVRRGRQGDPAPARLTRRQP